MCFLRHLPPGEADGLLDAAAAHRDTIIGVGLDSAERDFPPVKIASGRNSTETVGFGMSDRGRRIRNEGTRPRGAVAAP